ncbi:MAG: oligosaccharide flippase family protein [Terriglobia bacterium]
MSRSLYRRYLSAAGYTVSSGVVTRGALFLTSIIMARLLAPRDYGIYCLVISCLLALAPFAELRLDTGLVKFLPEWLASGKERVGSLVRSTYGLALILVLPVTAVVIISAGPLARIFYHQPGLSTYLALTAPVLIVLVGYQIGVGTLAGLQNFRSLAAVQGTIAILQIILMIPAAYYWKLNGAFAAYAASWACGAALVLVVSVKCLARRGMPFKGVRISCTECPSLIHFSLGYLLATISWPLSFWCGNAILTRFCGFESAALFTVAISFGVWALFLPGYFTNPSLPFLSEAYAAERLPEFRTIVARNLRLIWLLAAPLAIFFTASSKILISILYGDKFLSAWPAAGLLSLAAVMSGSIGVISQGFAGSGKIWEVAALNWLWVFSFGILAWLLAASWGVVGVGAAYLAATLLAYCAYAARARASLELKNTGAVLALTVLLPAFGLAFASAYDASEISASLIGAVLAFGSALVLWRFLFSRSERLAMLDLFVALRGKLRGASLQANV